MSPQPLVANKLAGKKVAVIGGSSGIGFGVASALIEEGAIVIISSSSAEKVEKAVARLNDASKQYNADSSRVSGHTVNLKGPETEASLTQFFEKVGTVDHIVHTAGDALAVLPLDQVTHEKVLDAAQVRFVSVILTAKVGARHLVKGGSFVFTGGSIALKPAPNWIINGGVAAGLHGLTRQLAYDLSPKHLRVNIVALGPVKTELWSGMTDEEREKFYKEAAAGHLTRHMADPHEVAQAYLYLMKDTNITGEFISSDSGHRFGPPPSQD